MKEQVSPTCEFARSVLRDYAQDTDSVPEEALEAARQHAASCERCSQSTEELASVVSATRKQRKVRRHGNDKTAPKLAAAKAPVAEITISATTDAPTGLSCQQCQSQLPAFAEALEGGQDAEQLYPQVQAHFANCTTNCLLLLELLQQELRESQQAQPTHLRNPLSVMGWALVGFFRRCQFLVSAKLFSGSILALLVIFGVVGGSVGYLWSDALAHPTVIAPDGIGLSDGLQIFDACNEIAFQKKRSAAQALRESKLKEAQQALKEALDAAQSDTTGCNGAEAAIYQQNLSIRQSGRPYSIVLVSFDSSSSSSDKHTLYAAYTQQLIGAYIGQQQYNTEQQKIDGAPLLYLVLANTAGSEMGAEQLAKTASALAQGVEGKQFGLLSSSEHPLLGVLGFGPGELAQTTLPTFCKAGIPLIAPTAMEQFISTQLAQVSLYRHCAPGFAFTRLSPDTAMQGERAANYAFNTLKLHDAAAIYDPGNPTSSEMAQAFSDNFARLTKTRIAAREALRLSNDTISAEEVLQAGLDDALRANPQVIFAPLLTNHVTYLARAIAHLPVERQPVLLIGGTFVRPAALQGLVQWVRAQQLSLPHIYIVAASAARPPIDGSWSKQFYAIFCTTFAHPGSYCSGAAALEQGALLFGDGISLLAQGVGPISDASKLPTRDEVVRRLNRASLAGVSGDIQLTLHNDVVITNDKARPLILTLQQDGSIQVIG
jgi:hypothetical protein